MAFILFLCFNCSQIGLQFLFLWFILNSYSGFFSHLLQQHWSKPWHSWGFNKVLQFDNLESFNVSSLVNESESKNLPFYFINLICLSRSINNLTQGQWYILKFRLFNVKCFLKNVLRILQYLVTLENMVNCKTNFSQWKTHKKNAYFSRHCFTVLFSVKQSSLPHAHAVMLNSVSSLSLSSLTLSLSLFSQALSLFCISLSHSITLYSIPLLISLFSLSLSLCSSLARSLSLLIKEDPFGC